MRAHCAWCGADISGSHSYPDPDSCGERECDREVGYMIAAARDERRVDAEEDDWSRY